MQNCERTRLIYILFFHAEEWRQNFPGRNLTKALEISCQIWIQSNWKKSDHWEKEPESRCWYSASPTNLTIIWIDSWWEFSYTPRLWWITVCAIFLKKKILCVSAYSLWRLIFHKNDWANGGGNTVILVKQQVGEIYPEISAKAVCHMPRFRTTMATRTAIQFL